MAVGTPGDDANGTNSGSVYLYHWNGSSYDEYKIIALDGVAGDSFGCSVSISGDTLVVGAANSESAYVYDIAALIGESPSVAQNDFNGDAGATFFSRTVPRMVITPAGIRPVGRSWANMLPVGK